MLEAKQVRK